MIWYIVEYFIIGLSLAGLYAYILGKGGETTGNATGIFCFFMVFFWPILVIAMLMVALYAKGQKERTK